MRHSFVYIALISAVALANGCVDNRLGYSAYYPSYAPILHGPCYSYDTSWGTGPRLALTTTRHPDRHLSPAAQSAIGGGPNSGCTAR